MGVPFETLLPYGIIIAMFGITGVGLHAVKSYANDGKRARWNTDRWDKVIAATNPYQRGGYSLITDNCAEIVMERDMRITGKFRAQSSNAVAPKGFEVSNPWKLEKRIV